MAGHSALARMIKMDPAVIAALRAGAPLPDPKLEALHRFTTIVVRERGFATDADVEAFLAAGFTRQNVLEVILGVATKVMSNYNEPHRTYAVRPVHEGQRVDEAGKVRRLTRPLGASISFGGLAT